MVDVSRLVPRRLFERSTDGGRTWAPCTRADVRLALGYTRSQPVMRGLTVLESMWGSLYRRRAGGATRIRPDPTGSGSA